MLVKYTLGWLFLFACCIVFAQPSDLVEYERIHETKNKRKKTVSSLRNVQLIYAPDCLLFKSSEGTDTVFLSSIDKASKYFPHGKTFKIHCRGETDLILLYFYNRKSAKEFKKFMRKNISLDKNHCAENSAEEFLIGFMEEPLFEFILTGIILLF